MDKYKPPKSKLGHLHVVQSRGGMITVRERAVLNFGEKSLVQNMRCWHPGFETRKGYTKLNSTPDAKGSDNSPVNIYQFVKGKTTESHLYVQDDNGDLLEADAEPPGTSTDLGDIVIEYSSGTLKVGCFANVDDYMLYSNGAVQQKVFAGAGQSVEAFIVVKAAGAHDYLPALGEDYTRAVVDVLSSDAAILDSLGDYAVDWDAFYIMTKTPADSIYFSVSKANGTASILAADYWDGSAWANDTIVDGTSAAGKSFSTSGAAVFDTAAADRTDEQPRYMFGQVGYWYKFYLSSGDFDAEVESDWVTYTCDGFISLVNIWNGVETDTIQAFFYDDSESNYLNYSGDSISIAEMTSSDFVYWSSPYPLEGAYLDFGATTNATSSNPTFSYWDGTAWQAVSELAEGTVSMTSSGWVVWQRPSDEQTLQFKDTKYHAYWYRIAVAATIDASTVMSILGMPYFNIGDLGSVGNVCATWKDRALYTFNKFPRDIYVTETGEHMKINGSDFAILQPGDGRSNATTAIVNFYNEIIVFQEERGAKGGCVTLFEGYSPETFGKLVLSTNIGTFSPKTVAVVDGSKASITNSQLNSQTMVFFLSHYGVFMSDGKVVTCISDDIQNYFDTRFAECIRTGYENEMWLEFDSTENLIKIGIVSGPSSEVANKYFCFDIADGQWYEDVYAVNLSCFREIESSSGQFHTLQVAYPSTSGALGGDPLGYLYLMNNGLTDDGTVVTWKLTWEFSQGPYFVGINEILTRAKTQAGISYTWTAEENDLLIETKTGLMTAAVTGHTIKRNRHLQNTHDIPWITFTMTGTGAMYLHDIGVIADATEFK